MDHEVSVMDHGVFVMGPDPRRPGRGVLLVP
jgi:hypothetical protein